MEKREQERAAGQRLTQLPPTRYISAPCQKVAEHRRYTDWMVMYAWLVEEDKRLTLPEILRLQRLQQIRHSSLCRFSRRLGRKGEQLKSLRAEINKTRH